MTAQHVLAAASIVSLVACAPAGRSQAEVLAATDVRPLHTAAPASSLTDTERAAFVNGVTTPEVYAFVPGSAASRGMKTGICLYDTERLGEVTYVAQSGGVFKLPAHVHVFVVGPIGGQPEFYTIATDDGFAGVDCPNAIAIKSSCTADNHDLHPKPRII